MINRLNSMGLGHAIVALAMQAVFILAGGGAWLGAAFAVAFYLGREVANAEARIAPQRKTVWHLPDWLWFARGWHFGLWDAKNWRDLLIPSAAVLMVVIGKDVI